MPRPPLPVNATAGNLDLAVRVQESLSQFRRTMLLDMRTLLQSALQEVLDKQAILADNSAQNMQQLLKQQTTAVGHAVGHHVRTLQELRQDAALSKLEDGDAFPPPSGYGEAVELSGRTATTCDSEEAPVYEEPGSVGVRGSASLEVGVRGSVRRRAPTKDAVIQEMSASKSVQEARNFMRKSRQSPTRSGSDVMAGGGANGTGGGAVSGARRASLVFGNMKKWLTDGTDFDQKVYNVFDLYHDSGMLRAIATGGVFNNLTLCVICLNALYMGVEADWNKAENLARADWPFQLAEHGFCLFFSVEICIRFGAFAKKKHCLRDHWFKFDAVLATMMVTETWFLAAIFGIIGGSGSQGNFSALLRLLRLLRLARISRLMRALPELVIMVKGMIVAMRAVATAMGMLVLLIYVFAILMHTLNKDEEEMTGFFGNIRSSMLTLLLQGVFLDDLSSLTRELVRLESTMSLFFLAMFVMFTATTVMNMLIGILLEVVTQVASAEKEQAAKDQMKATLLVMLETHDKDGSGDITKDELQSVILDPDAHKVLEDLQVDIPHLVDLTEMLYESDDTRLTILEIMHLILALRGERPTTMQDIAASNNFLRFIVAAEMEGLEGRLRDGLKLSSNRTSGGVNHKDDPAQSVSDYAASWLGLK